MVVSNTITQNPATGIRVLKFRGDTQDFDLNVADDLPGNAWVRTNIGHAHRRRREIIAQVHHGTPEQGRDWFDIPMESMGEGRYRVRLALTEVGHFEAKCFFLPTSETTPVWAPGDNTTVNVEPANTCCANIIYNAFVRQFGPNKSGRFRDPSRGPIIAELDEAGFTVIPPSGTFRDLIAELDFIIGGLGCRIVHLLPIHPTPTTYARMGRFGSPYAALDFTAVDPALATFDPRATPMEQFIELVDAVHARGARLFMDIAINHTGWAADLHHTHPQWLMRDPDGTIEAPGAWGVTWADLTRLDYRHKGLWRYMADVFLSWCRRGADGFRCDAGYMIPVPAWTYIVARVREQFPDTIFLLEGLGGPMAATRELLDTAGMNWAYSELFQNYNRAQIEAYLPEPMAISATIGQMVHYAETHDNNRLASHSQAYARMRTALCALLAPRGAFGIANGVEWYATEKIDVHGSGSLAWGADNNQASHIRRLSTLLGSHPAFFDRSTMAFIQVGEGNYLAALRRHQPTGRHVLVVVNLDDTNPLQATWNHEQTAMKTHGVVDLLTGVPVAIDIANGHASCRLEPAQVLCLSDDPADLNLFHAPHSPEAPPERVIHQCLRATALEVYGVYHTIGTVGDFDPDAAARQLGDDPEAFCTAMNPEDTQSRVIPWQWPRDQGREVMVPPGHFLLVKAPHRFRAAVTANQRCLIQTDSLPQSSGGFFALLAPGATPARHRRATLKLCIHAPESSLHAQETLLFLAHPEGTGVRSRLSRRHLTRPRVYLGTNARGAMLRAPIAWGQIRSRYDALLAANLNPRFPEDRWIMLTRCRAWVVYQGYSQEIGDHCLEAFQSRGRAGARWRFQVPTGQGEHIVITLALTMVPLKNALAMVFHRCPSQGAADRLADQQLVQLILRPDIEDRNFHNVTKAYAGPEQLWPPAVSAFKEGFRFTPAEDRCLEVVLDGATFTMEPRWQYMVHRPLEAERGLDPDSDLFSPGYFTLSLGGGQTRCLRAGIPDTAAIAPQVIDGLAHMAAETHGVPSQWQPLDRVLTKALDQYIVRRGRLKSVVAGYPWFLDWGRDSLIVVRGLIATGKINDARDILHQFGRFEAEGTLPNMIRGDQAGDRATSDAPLWFFTACADLLTAQGDTSVLDASCGRRTLRETLFSMGNALCGRLSNGVYMDPESGLLFSPAHFTWMDTNHPAATPREGYAIEIQALWHAALSLLARIDGSETCRHWQDLASKVRRSITALFYLKTIDYLSDCRHGPPGVTAARADPDDALRPNQLFAITLGAIEDLAISKGILDACRELVVPGAIRTLANRRVGRPLPVTAHGKLLNTPHHPYQGRYEGDEDTRRKPAYHNGTAWSWVFPSFCEAWVKVYGDSAKPTARAWLCGSQRLVADGCVGHLPEIIDGNFPHTARGCDAQAWGCSEWLRVWRILR